MKPCCCKHYGSAVYMNGLCLLCKQCDCVRPMLSLFIPYVFSCSWCRARCARYWTCTILLYWCSISLMIILIEYRESLLKPVLLNTKSSCGGRRRRCMRVNLRDMNVHNITLCCKPEVSVSEEGCRISQLRRRGNKRKSTSNWARTCDLCSNAEFQSCKVWNQSYSFVSHRSRLCGHSCRHTQDCHKSGNGRRMNVTNSIAHMAETLR